jgi:ABC-type Fe3+-siderophore transport system permease subunit
MTDQQNSVNWRREELLSLLSTSGSLAGLCITIVALMNTFDKKRADVSIVDDMLAVCAAAFLLCVYLIFWALRSQKAPVKVALIKMIDGVFLLAMTSMTIAAFVMIYTIW